MKLNVAVQMDPIARINVSGDSTFALLLEAQLGVGMDVLAKRRDGRGIGEDGFDEGVIESAPGFEPLDLGGAG